MVTEGSTMLSEPEAERTTGVYTTSRSRPGLMSCGSMTMSRRNRLSERLTWIESTFSSAANDAVLVKKAKANTVNICFMIYYYILERIYQINGKFSRTHIIMRMVTLLSLSAIGTFEAFISRINPAKADFRFYIPVTSENP